MTRQLGTAYLILSLLAVTPALARIGETPEQCKARYGDPSKIIKEKKTMVFQKSGVLVIVEFFNGKADTIGFRKLEQNVLGMSLEFSDNEIQNLLKANSGGKEWKMRQIISINKAWTTEDGELIAHLEAMDNHLMIATRDNLDRRASEKKAREDKSLGGF
jgi:hypothetical protein